MTGLPILYSFRRCPYAMRARFALAVSGSVCRLREVALRDKPAELLAASPKATVPVLVLPDGTVIDESRHIMDWALARCDPDGWRPRDAAADAASSALVDLCDGPFKTALDRYKYPARNAGDDRLAARGAAATFAAALDTRLRCHANLMGPHASLADFAIFPFIRQFAGTDSAWFEIQPWPGLHAWLLHHRSGDLFTRVMARFAPWQTASPEPLFPSPV